MRPLCKSFPKYGCACEAAAAYHSENSALVCTVFAGVDATRRLSCRAKQVEAGAGLHSLMEYRHFVPTRTLIGARTICGL